MSGHNLPPGCTGFPEHANLLTFVCLHESCTNFEERWEARAFTELGGTFLYDDEKAFCHACGHEGEQVYL